MTNHINPWEAGLLAQEYDAWFETPTGSLTDKLETRLIMNMARPRPSERVLDVGTGTGHFALLLKEKGLRVTALDASPAMIEVASHKSDELTWQLGSADDLPFGDSQFDLVTCITALEFMANPTTALQEMGRVLKPGGRLIVGALNRSSSWAISRDQQALQTDTPFAHARYYQISELLDMLPETERPVRWNSSVFYGPDGAGCVEGHLREVLGRVFHRDRGALLVIRWDKS